VDERRDFKFGGHLRNGARQAYRDSYSGRLIGNDVWPIEWHECQ